MGSEIGADVPLDYVTFQILPENRYGASICAEEKEEMVQDGPLELLLEHLPSIKDQIVNGSCDNFKLESSNSITTREWFTKATLMRFLQIIGSSDALKKSITISNEMSQLEETRKFHLSLYTQADKISALDNSKNELLRAMDSRIAALTEELFSTFNLAAGAVFSFQEMIGLREFCQHFGDVDIRNLLMKLSEKTPKGQTIVPVNNKKSSIPLVSKSDYENKISGNVQIPRESNSLKPVQYDASPAKAAEIERQSSTGSDESSFSSEDERPPAAERSRTLIRSASPRRSASPMRKVQIGRSGSRRTPALTIRSLPYFPARERISSSRDPDNDGKLEESEEPNRRPDINVTRMSVQDAISLFESRQRDQPVENQKKVGVENFTNANKAVLRRWSSGMSESQKSMTLDPVESAASQSNTEDKDEHSPKSAEVKPDGNPDFENQMFKEKKKNDEGLEERKNIATSLSEDEDTINQIEGAGEKLDSAEWTRQKEEELNKMLVKFAEYNLSNIKNTDPDNKQTNQVSRMGKSGLLNGHHRERRDEKISGEKSVKRVEKQLGNRAKQRVPDKSKQERSSPKVNDTVKKLPASRTSAVNKSGPIYSDGKKESSKAAVPKRAPSRTSPLSATRKSWPATPSPRITGTLPTRSPTVTPPSVTSAPRQKSQYPAPRQKSQSPAPVSRPSPKLEKPQVQQKDMKKQHIEAKKSVKKVDESKIRTVPKNGKTTKIKTVAAPEEDAPAAISPAKGVVRKKVTKKSSVVPLEVKPSVRKVSEKSPAKSPVSQKRDVISQAEETASKSEDIQNVVVNVGTITSDKIDLVEAQDSETQNGQHVELEIESETEKRGNGRENEVFVEAPQGNEVSETMMDSPAKISNQPAQESEISPDAWVESDHQDTTIIRAGDNSSSSVANPDGMRVRHSLSQMLLEEISEPDIIEWGNAEHPPSMVYQKDAPKGFKRLLKFARKNKEANGAAWASPYTSEGEDDGDEYRNLGKGKSDNLLKAALHSKNYGEGFLSDNEPLSARSNASNTSARSSNKFQDGHGSSKGARSFFSLSAFRGKN